MKMRRILILSLLTCFSLSLSLQVAGQGDCESLVWFDEFDTDGAPNTAKWGYDTGGGGWGNNELQTYTNTRTNSWVDNGKLFIKAVKTNNSWSSARLITKDKGDWLYGRIEVKAKLPSGRGTWPAIWMLPTDWAYGGWPASGEIDIMEHVGYDPGVVHGTVHTQAFNHSIGTQVGKSIQVPDAMSSFHVYAIEWTPESIKWYLDGELYFTFNNQNKTSAEWPFDKRFHLLLNIAIGGDWGGAQGIDPNLTEAVMEVDYVRVYNNKLPKPVIQGSNLNTLDDEVTYAVNDVAGAQYTWTLPDGVSILSGEGTSSITVRWNDAPGDIHVEVSTACDAVVSNVFHVDYLIQPGSDRWDVFPANEAQQLLWQANAGTGNSLNLSEENDALTVDFDITDPGRNPNLYYNFDGLIDLTAINELALELKVDPDNPPSNLRFDLVDVNGNVELVNLFQMNSFDTDESFHFHYHHFASKSDGSFLLNKIAQIRVYVNFGIFGKAGSGRFVIQNMRFQEATSTSVHSLARPSSVSVYPNPARDFVTIVSDEMIQDVQLFSLQGSLIFSKSAIRNQEYQLKFGDMQPGIYLIKVNHSQSELISIR